jgi:hypothetical protein
VLTDTDIDAVETRFIQPFSFGTVSNGLRNVPTHASYSSPGGGLPKTSESTAPYHVAVLLFSLAVGAAALHFSGRIQRRRQKTEKNDAL